MKKQVLIVVLSIALIISCTKSNDSNNNHTTNNVTCTGTKLFSSDVSPIIQSICANSGCHDASSTNGVGPLTNYQQVFNSRTSIRSAVASGIMPKNTTLTSDQKNAILCWIDSGASNN
jgi:uncharacterized membrane protein